VESLTVPTFTNSGLAKPIPEGFIPTAYIPALIEIIELLKLNAGDPAKADKALFYEQNTVADTAVVKLTRTQAQAENYSILIVTFSETSGRGRYQITGSDPTAAGVGMPIISGGSTLTIRGIDNINNFRMIAETGQAMQYNALLFKAQAWMAASYAR
jgi:hypothetical protein